MDFLGIGIGPPQLVVVGAVAALLAGPERIAHNAGLLASYVRRQLR